ncbi:MAG: hypothetical protein M3N93_04065 [Acidobacteriota bacterium]|nr:hypothetical protein [Acidobacteriota bacterium]
MSCEDCDRLGREHLNAFERYKLGVMQLNTQPLEASELPGIDLAIHAAQTLSDAAMAELLFHLKGHASE